MSTWVRTLPGPWQVSAPPHCPQGPPIWWGCWRQERVVSRCFLGVPTLESPPVYRQRSGLSLPHLGASGDSTWGWGVPLCTTWRHGLATESGGAPCTQPYWGPWGLAGTASEEAVLCSAVPTSEGQAAGGGRHHRGQTSDAGRPAASLVYCSLGASPDLPAHRLREESSNSNTRPSGGRFR